MNRSLFPRVAMAGAVVASLGLRALAAAPDYSPIAVDGDGNVTAAPANLISVVSTGLVTILAGVAAIKLIKVLAGYVFRWFRG